MSISDKISRLRAAKTNIANAITVKGGEVAENDGFEEFATDISTIPEGVKLAASYTIADGALTAATVTLDGDLTVIIPDGVVTIGEGTFKNNSVITKVVMPNTVTEIEESYLNGAFSNCINLKSIDFSSNLLHIGAYTFMQCTFDEITLPQSLQGIGEYCFSSCQKLKIINVPDSVIELGAGFLSGCISLKTFVFPNAITKIPNNAFYQSNYLENVVIPATVTEIEYGAFNISVSTLDVYFKGTQAQWESITIGNNNGALSTATIHYEYNGDGSELFE